MSRSLVLQILALALLVMVAASELKIDVTHKPEECKLKTRKGDQLAMQ